MNSSLKNLICTTCAALLLAADKPAQARPAFGSVPLWFEPSGSNGDVFTAHTHDAEFQVTASGAEFILRKPGANPASVHMTFAGSAPAEISAGAKLEGTINHLAGNDPAQWRTAVPAYGSVQLENVYPGVSVIYYGDDKNLEYDFNLSAGADPDTIAIRFEGAEKITINTDGELRIQAGGGEIIQHKPVAYQMVSGKRQPIDAGYVILDAHTAAFKIGAFNHSLPLVIDPVLGYSTYFGGNHGDIIHAIAMGADGSIYAAGETLSTTVTNSVMLATTNAYQTNFAGGTISGDAFVAKFDPTGTNLVYFTYLGGYADDAALGLAVDAAGDAFVTGYTDSTNFPVANALFPKIAGSKNSVTEHYPVDVFVAELDPTGANLIYSTFLGGEAADIGTAIAIDNIGTAYVAGYTYSTNLPVTTNAYQTKLKCTNSLYFNANAFVAEIAPNGTNLNYLSYFGGTNNDIANAICYKNGMLFVAGQTSSTNYPWVKGLAQCAYLNGNTNLSKKKSESDAFVTAFQVNGADLEIQYSTFLGSTNDDVATGIAADSAGNAYVVGWTVSTNFPVITNGVQLSSFIRTNTAGLGIATNGFLTKIAFDWADTNQNAVVINSQLFGGDRYDVASGVALDSGGNNIYVIGTETSRTNYNAIDSPIYGSLRATNSGLTGTSDAFVMVLKSDFSSLLYSACIGGKKNDFGNAIAVDNDGNAIIAGQTVSTNFPVLNTLTNSTTAVHSYRDGTNDTFIARILTGVSPHLHAVQSGTNVLVFWAPISDMNPTSNIPIEAASNLLMVVQIVSTNGFYLTTNQSNHKITTNYLTATNPAIEANTNWVIVTNPAPVLINSNFTYTFDPTNAMQFYRFDLFK